MRTYWSLISLVLNIQKWSAVWFKNQHIIFEFSSWKLTFWKNSFQGENSVLSCKPDKLKFSVCNIKCALLSSLFDAVCVVILVVYICSNIALILETALMSTSKARRVWTSVCMHVRVHLSMCVGASVCVVSLSTYIYLSRCAFDRVCVHLCVSVTICNCLWVCVCVFPCPFVCVFLSVRMCVCASLSVCVRL